MGAVQRMSQYRDQFPGSLAGQDRISIQRNDISDTLKH